MIKHLRLPLTLLLLSASLLSLAQGNPFAKKYAGAYYLLNFGEETPSASSEKITLTIDGKWSSVSSPLDDNGTVSKVPVKKAGTWKASDGLIQITINGSPTVTDFKLDNDLFMSSDKYLQKIFVTNPVFLAKYAGSFKVLGNSEEHPTDFSETITFKADGKCSRSTPTVDDAGNVTKTPVVVAGTWKANDGVIQMTFPEEGQERMTEFKLSDGVFADRAGNRLEKALPPIPAVNYLPRYAGVYNMLANGQPATASSDKYVLTADGKGTWTYFLQGAAPVTVKGTWKASDGLIQLYFSPDTSSDKGDGMLTDFKWQDGAFRAEGVVLKKMEAKSGAIKK